MFAVTGISASQQIVRKSVADDADVWGSYCPALIKDASFFGQPISCLFVAPFPA